MLLTFYGVRGSIASPGPTRPLRWQHLPVHAELGDARDLLFDAGTGLRPFALDAEVGALVMFHHDPERTDSQLDEIQRENQTYFKKGRAAIKSYCARESMLIGLTTGKAVFDIAWRVGSSRRITHAVA